jgi:hypothetical protein
MPLLSLSLPLLPASLPAATNATVSSKAIDRRTANDYASVVGGMIFRCPVPNCKAKITPLWTVKKFYKHMEDAFHTNFYSENDQHECPFGCEKGSLNEFALHCHIQESRCKMVDDLKEKIHECWIPTSPYAKICHLESCRNAQYFRETE